MEVILGKLAGFCNGVRNAVEKTEELLKNRDKIYCLGELAHNKQVIKDLENDGLIIVDDLNEVPNNSEVIFRAHGVTKSVYQLAKEKNLTVYDYSCVRVIKLHEDVENMNNNDYYIFLFGDNNHPEVIGTKSFANSEEITVLKDIKEVDSAINNLKKSNLNKLYICAQTTFSLKKFDELVSIIEEKLEKNNNDDNIEIKINKSICEVTEIRQMETENLAREVDFMVIIGGKNSSNTIKLYEISKKNCKRAIHIETKEELENVDFSKVSKVGVMAGASTPKKSINEVIEYLNKRSM